jgi:hypothetical protein
MTAVFPGGIQTFLPALVDGLAGDTCAAVLFSRAYEEITAMETLLARTELVAYFSRTYSMAANLSLVDGDSPLQWLDPNGSARDVTLPANATSNHVFVIINTADAAETITVKNAAATTIGTVAQGETKIFVPSGSAWAMVSGGGGGTNPTSANILINGGFDIWQRGGTGSAVTMTDDIYNAPDRWNSLIQGSNPTIQRSTGLTNSPYSCKLTAGGTSYRHGIEQIVESANSIQARGKSIIAQCLVKPVKNAGSGTIDMRIAILEWTGTADAVTSDIINDWTSGTYTTGNFFNTTSLTLIGTAQISAAHNTITQLSVTGTVSQSCNNLIILIWTEDVPAHASDYVLISEAGLYIASTVQAWLPKPTGQELELCQRYCWKDILAVAYASLTWAYVQATGTNFYGYLSLPTPMRNYATATFSCSAAANFYLGGGLAQVAILLGTLSEHTSGSILKLYGTAAASTASTFRDIGVGNTTTDWIMVESEL